MRFGYINLWRKARIVEILPKLTFVGEHHFYDHKWVLELAFLIFSFQITKKRTFLEEIMAKEEDVELN